MSAGTVHLQLAHSPDPDDAFMWWPLFEVDGAPPALDTGRYRFSPVTDDIQSLNERSLTGELEITAVSCAQYPRIADRYALTACGSSMGDAYGPKLVAREPITVDELRSRPHRVAIPGRQTSAYATACLMLGTWAIDPVVVPFESIIDRIATSDDLDAGIVIHEGQLTFADAGLHLVTDLGAWWTSETGLPLPLGANVIRRDLDALYGEGTLVEVTSLLRASIDHALSDRETAVRYALRYARGMDAGLADEFVALYVNAWTLDYGERGRDAVRTFLHRTAEAGLTPDPGEIDMIAVPTAG